MHPKAMVSTGAHLISSKSPAISPADTKTIDPIAIKAIPHSWKKNYIQLVHILKKI